MSRLSTGKIGGLPEGMTLAEFMQSLQSAELADPGTGYDMPQRPQATFDGTLASLVSQYAMPSTETQRGVIGGPLPIHQDTQSVPGNYGPGSGAIRGRMGNIIPLGSSQGTGVGPQFDMSKPIDYMGRKGFHQADGRILDADGNLIADTRGVEKQQAEIARVKQFRDNQDYDLKTQEMKAKIAKESAPDWQIDLERGVAINKRDPSQTKPISAPQKAAGWTYDAGSDEFVQPPSAEYPQGRRSGNASKINAEKSMNYIIDQFAGTADKPGPIETTQQGGVMGLQGLTGKVINSQDAKRFDNLKEQLSTELRTLFRIPGEGALSDKEQAQYGVQLPSITNDKETNKKILIDIRNRAAIRNGTAQPTPTGADKNNYPSSIDGWTLKVDKHGNKAYVSPDGKQFREVK